MNDALMRMIEMVEQIFREARQMTENEWLSSEDPAAMLAWETGLRSTWPGTQLASKASDRKLRLFACATWRNRSMRFQAGPIRDGQMLIADAGERLADGLLVKDRPAPEPDSMTDFAPLVDNAMDAATMMASPLDASEGCQQADLLRDIAGNPYRPVTLQSKWLTPTILAIATAAYEERPGRKCEKCDGEGWLWWNELKRYDGPARLTGQDDTRYFCDAIGCSSGRIEDGTLDNGTLSILADALEDAGCDNEDILAHLRSPGPHVRGCFVLDLILGKE